MAGVMSLPINSLPQPHPTLNPENPPKGVVQLTLARGLPMRGPRAETVPLEIEE
jgi:hypothetical protein